MRKISKSKAVDDNISTSGSVTNDETLEKEQANGGDNDGDDDEADNGAQSDAGEPIPKDPPKKRSRKGTKKQQSSSKAAAKDEDVEDKDYEDEVDNGDKSDDDSVSKHTPKKKTKGAKKTIAKAAEDDEEEEEEFEVDKIIDSKKIKGKLHYLIRWKGYSADGDTWEPENTVSCPDLLSKYHNEQKSSKTTPKKNTTKGAKKRKGTAKGGPEKKTKKLQQDSDDDDEDENAEYEVDRILEVHHKKDGKREFLIHWKGWSPRYDSWEPEANLNCSELIKKFMDKVTTARSKDARALRVAPEATNRFTLQAQSSARRLSKRRGQQQRVRYDNAE